MGYIQAKIAPFFYLSITFLSKFSCIVIAKVDLSEWYGSTRKSGKRISGPNSQWINFDHVSSRFLTSGKNDWCPWRKSWFGNLKTIHSFVHFRFEMFFFLTIFISHNTIPLPNRFFFSASFALAPHRYVDLKLYGCSAACSIEEYIQLN